MASVFWKGAVGTRKQKAFWIVFSIIVAFIALILIALLSPPVGFEVTYLKAGEWAHLYPNSFWHNSAVYSLTTVPIDKKEDGKEVKDVTSYVYDMGVHGKSKSFDMKADKVDVLFNPKSNWSESVYMTFDSSVSVTVDPTGVSLDFLATTDKDVFDKWLSTGEIKDKSKALEYQHGVQQLSVTVEIDGVDRFLYSRRVYFGLIETPGKTGVYVASIMFYRHILQVPTVNSTKFVDSDPELPFNSLSLLEIQAPATCTDNSTSECRLIVVLQARWLLFLGIVVVPIIIISVGLVIGLMAIKALHVRQMVALMRKKANHEEGVALEEGKSKDIHTEKLEEEDGEEHVEKHSDDTHSTEEETHEEAKEEVADAAVLVAGDDTDRQ